ncbi:MAG: cupin domain-containing protein [Phycisphaerales bacterium]|nr:cupin domain-containing protein [Phycisphaerales bacterium]
MNVGNATFATVALLIAIAASGCAARDDAVSQGTQQIDPVMIARALEHAPCPADRDFYPQNLLITERFSMHLLQFRTAEQRHIHRRHDLTFVVVRGTGEVWVNDRRFQAKPGDVFHIPRGTPHYCVNTGDAVLAAVLTFTPPFDRSDSIPVARGARSYDREGPTP